MRVDRLTCVQSKNFIETIVDERGRPEKLNVARLVSPSILTVRPSVFSENVYEIKERGFLRI